MGIDGECANTFTQTNKDTNTNTSTSTTTMDAQAYSDKSKGLLFYNIPVIDTKMYNITDFNGAQSKTNPRIMYLSTYHPGHPFTNSIKTYNLTNPGEDSVFSGMKSAPSYNNFENWSWSTWSGGWHNRNWESNSFDNPYRNQYETIYFAENDPLLWDEGNVKTEGKTMENSNQYAFSHEEKASVKSKIFGFSSSEAFSYSQDETITTDNSNGFVISYADRIAKDGVCGIEYVQIQPMFLTPKTGSLPWIPTVFSNYRPWLFTYDVLSVEPSDGCSVTSSALQSTKSSIKTSIIPAEAGNITLPDEGIIKGATGQVQAVPVSGYKFLYWEGYGINLDDYSSTTVNATVTTDYSTIRAVFANQSQDLVKTGMITIQNGTTGNQIKIQGKIPSGFSKFHALNLKTPVEVKVGGLTFPFGLSVGNVTVVSDHELAFTTTDSKKGNSHLTVDFGTNTWCFAAYQVGNIENANLGNTVVNIGIGGKNLSVSEDVMMTGKEELSWPGLNKTASNVLFSLQNATINARLHFLNSDTEYDRFNLENADLKASSISSTDPLTFAINAISLKFNNATQVEGNTLTYQKIGKDLNATITVNNQTKVWNAKLSGKRLAHHYVSSNLSIRLSVGNVSNSSEINPTQATMLRTPNIVPSDIDAFLSDFNGV